MAPDGLDHPTDLPWPLGPRILSRVSAEARPRASYGVLRRACHLHPTCIPWLLEPEVYHGLLRPEGVHRGLPTRRTTDENPIDDELQVANQR